MGFISYLMIGYISFSLTGLFILFAWPEMGETDALTWQVIFALLVPLLIFAYSRLSEAFRAAVREVQARDERQWQEVETQRPLDRHSNRRLFLHTMQLIITPRRGRKRTLGRHVNPREVESVRPVIELVLNDETLADKKLPLDFNIVDPRGRTRYSVSLKPRLELGINRISPTSSVYPIYRNAQEGIWYIRLWVGGKYSWAEQTFTISTKPVDELGKELIGDDMEIVSNRAELDARVLQGQSIDELLKD